ncbi:MAG: hypothetical protein ACLVD8_18825 [Enterocloster sp.]
MKRKILTITYTCPEDKVNLGEADIMGYHPPASSGSWEPMIST